MSHGLRIWAMGLIATGLGSLVACQTSPPAWPELADATSTLSEAAAVRAGGVATVGRFELHWDPATEQATLTNVPLDRAGQTQGDLYHLPTGAYQTPATLLGNTAEPGTCPGCWRFDYAISHPFAAPSDPLGDATAANRADLGFAGMVVVMAPAPADRVTDVSSARYRGDYEFTFNSGGLNAKIITNTKLVRNADGFVNPRGMLDLGDFAPMNGANAWPYKQLVDESLDSRWGGAVNASPPISNGGNETGNYNAGQGGWQFGLNGTLVPWTGYGVLHQGQTATNALVLDIAQFTSLNLAGIVLAKYTDPRGGSSAANKRANRLPLVSGPTFFANKFAYRMPWGALDIQRMTGTPPTLIGAAPATLAIRFEDLDFAASEDSGFPGTNGTNLDRIPIGTMGLKSMRVASTELALNLLSTTVAGGTGRRNDPVRVDMLLQNTTGISGGQDVGAYVMALAIDPEVDNVPVGYTRLTLDDFNPPRPVPLAADWYVPVVCQVYFVPVL